ncbi:MAG: hypothetical protein N2657_06160 [bacterium]|nr:hypothetical protein [bacterium]
MKILFLSNGYGEDTIASYIIKAFPPDLRKKIYAFPLVTEGSIFKEEGIKICGPIRVLPSRGISGLLNLKNFIIDIKSGLIQHVIQQVNFIKNLDKDFYFVAVGDIYPLSILYLTSRISKAFFVATAKSIKTEIFNFFEIHIMKKVIASFVRDNSTQEWIQKKYKLSNVYFFGNPVLDIPLADSPDILKNIEKSRNIIFLPGRVNEALKNINLLLPAMREIVSRGYTFCIVVPDFYPLEEIRSIISSFDQSIFLVSSRYYRFLLERSFLAWGFAGSANEQAAGFGIPVISLNEKNWYRQRQKKLLKDSLILVENPYDFISKTLELANNPEYYGVLSNAGKIEMGPPGGASLISSFIIQFCKNSEKIAFSSKGNNDKIV